VWFDEKEELRVELEQGLQWVKYRTQMLNIMEGKLQQMIELAEQAKDENISREGIENLNAKINDLLLQVNALDQESKNIENKSMVE
jgi:hypothetical protein